MKALRSGRIETLFTPRLRSVLSGAGSPLIAVPLAAVDRASRAGSTVPGIPTDGSVADTAERVVDSVVTISTTR